jgi:hypothetical protein
MVTLLNSIEGIIITTVTADVSTLNLSTEIGQGDYINVGTVRMYLQNFINASELDEYTTPILFGFKTNKEYIELTVNA